MRGSTTYWRKTGSNNRLSRRDTGDTHCVEKTSSSKTFRRGCDRKSEPGAVRWRAKACVGACPLSTEQGTEIIYKIDSTGFHGADHLRRILAEAQIIVDEALAEAPQDLGIPSVPREKKRP